MWFSLAQENTNFEMEDLQMLGANWLRGIRRYLPWYQNIEVKVTSVCGNNIFLENLSDLKEKRRKVRMYSLHVALELNGINPEDSEEVNRFRGDLADLICCYATINFKSDELWHYVVPGISRTYYGKLKTLPACHI